MLGPSTLHHRRASGKKVCLRLRQGSHLQPPPLPRTWGMLRTSREASKSKPSQSAETRLTSPQPHATLTHYSSRGGAGSPPRGLAPDLEG